MSSRAGPQAIRRCQLCALGQLATPVGRPIGTWAVAYADPALLVLVGRVAGDVVVTPRPHLARLTTTARMAAPVLSAVRVVVNTLRSELGASDPTVHPTSELVGTGHIGFRVVATNDGTPPGATSADGRTLAQIIAYGLGSYRRPSPGEHLVNRDDETLAFLTESRPR
jgi:hypothetical protein